MAALLNWIETGTGKDKAYTATADVNGTAVAFEIVKTGGGRFRLLVDGEKAGADSPKHAAKKDEAEEIVKERMAAVPPAPAAEAAPEETAPEVVPQIAQEVETAPAPQEMPLQPAATAGATQVAVEAVPAAMTPKAEPKPKDGWTKKKIKQPTVSPCGRASVVELDDAGKQWKATVNGTTDEQVFKTMKAAKEFCSAELSKLPALSRG